MEVTWKWQTPDAWCGAPSQTLYHNGDAVSLLSGTKREELKGPAV